MIVIVLQNAWSPVYAGRVWPRESWLRALHRSRSGQRLRVLTDRLRGPVYHTNTTPKIGKHPSHKLPPQERHICGVLRRKRPTRVIACGKQAGEILPELWDGRLLCIPHPAYRLLTNELLIEAARVAQSLAPGEQLALRQLEGGIECLPLKRSCTRET